MNPKSGKVIKSVKPVAPDKPQEADQADPGEVAKIKAKQREEQAGKYGATPVEPFKPADAAAADSDDGQEEEPAPDGWVEVELVDEDDQPVAGVRYQVTLPDGRVASGTLDQNGFVRIEGFEPGECQVTFPDLDKEAWEKA